MSIKTFLSKIFGIPRRKKKNVAFFADIDLARQGWGYVGLLFCAAGYNPDEWLSPRSKDIPLDLHEYDSRSLIQLNLHPLSSYRALGLSHVVDHWVPWVSTEGWGKIEDAYAPRGLGNLRQWAHIEHSEFWKAVATMLAVNDTTSSHTQALLQHAGWAGNIVPFQKMHFDHAIQYSQTTKTCHSRVALWLQSKNLWKAEDLVSSLGEWRDLFPLHGITFLNFIYVPIAYVQEWLVLLLAYYPLTQEQKVSLVGQAIIAFGPDAWEHHFAKASMPYLDGIDMDLVHAVCGNADTISFAEKKRHSTLYKTTRLLTHDVSIPFEREGIKSIDISNNNPGTHNGLLLLLEIQQPNNRSELYTLAKLAKDIELGLVAAPDIIALPELSF